MKNALGVCLGFSLSLAADFAAGDQGFLELLEGDVFRSAIMNGSAGCLAAFETLKKPSTRTVPAERVDAAMRVRQCFQEDRARQMERQKDRAALTYQIYDSYIELIDMRIDEEEASENFRGISFGVGVGVSFSDDDIIATADIDPNNVVRATKDESTQPRVILESHYYGWCRLSKCNEGWFGIGPYFGIVAKNDDLISAFSTGLMIGWKDSNKPSSAGFSIGIGAILDSDVQSLASGFEDGEPLPAGETQIRFKTESRWGAIVFFTRTF